MVIGSYVHSGQAYMHAKYIDETTVSRKRGGPMIGPLKNLKKQAGRVSWKMRRRRIRQLKPCGGGGRSERGVRSRFLTAAQMWAALKKVRGPASLERGRWRRERDSKAMMDGEMGLRRRRAKYRA
jgi:hypothetical protein